MSKGDYKSIKIPIETYRKWKQIADELSRQTGRRYTMADAQRMWAKEDRTVVKAKKLDYKLF